MVLGMLIHNQYILVDCSCDEIEHYPGEDMVGAKKSINEGAEVKITFEGILYNLTFSTRLCLLRVYW